MLGMFPTPYPDELLYSVCARYSSIFKYPQKNMATKDLFGTNAHGVQIEFPRGLSHLISVLPGEHKFTLESIINNHTMLPFYAPFLMPERLERILSAMMETSKQTNSGSSMPINTTLIKNSYYLRFCPLCAKEDFQQYGEYYWHRMHQLQGIVVCYTHKAFLENSSVESKRRVKIYEIINANEGIQIKRCRPIDLNDLHHQVLLQLAKDATWLLNKPVTPNEFELLQNRYIQLLVNKNLARLTGILRTGEIKEQFIKFYTQRILKKLNCALPKKSDTWLSRLIPGIDSGNAFHPVHHLLLLQFLGIEAPNFFKLGQIKINNKPYGNGPWPCLDPTSDHFRQLTIEKYHITIRRDNCASLSATFKCYCGFGYTRVGPETSSEERFKYNQPIAFSESWENKLRELWPDQSLSIESIANILGIKLKSLKRYSRLLNLVRDSSEEHKNPSDLKNKKISLQSEFKANIKQYRNDFLEHLKKFPGANRRTLYINDRRLACWLSRYDKEWYDKHRPPSLKNNIIDWEARDRKLSKEIRTAVKHILNIEYKPIRITIPVISKIIKCNKNLFIRPRNKKLPLCMKVLEEVIEPYETFVVRKIKWLEAYYLKGGICPPRSTFMRNLGSETVIVKYEKARQALDSALENLKSSIKS